MEEKEEHSAEIIIEERKKKIVGFFKSKKQIVFYILLAIITWLGAYIRMLPTKINPATGNPKLWDITTGTWTLGPDLDPFLFLRWAKYIIEHGKLMTIDMMRYVPLGYDTSGEMKLLSYMMAWFYQVISVFYKEITVTYAAIIFPVFMFALTTIVFFLFARKVFYKESITTKNIIALIATLFFVLIPLLIPRTIAGIPEKESAAFFFMFLSFYLFLEAFTSEKLKRGLIYGVLAGIFTGLMGLIWGGVIFIFLTISASVFLSFILGKVKIERFYVYCSWLIISFITMMPFSARYTLKNLFVSFSTGSAIGVLAIIGMSLLIIKTKWINKIREKINIPQELVSSLISVFALIILISILFGVDVIISNINEIKTSLIQPSVTRFSFTVAENKQPYFADDWINGFEPIFKGIPLFFWLFFIGSIFLFNKLINNLEKKEKILLTFSYFIFLTAIIFSRYSESSIMNGTNLSSLIFYFGGAIFFIISFLYIYIKKYKKNDFHIFEKFEFTYILYFIILTLGIVGARGAIRLIMVLGAVSPVVVSFFSVKICQRFFREKDEFTKFLVIAVSIIVVISLFLTFITYFKIDKITGENYAPGIYQWQWQKTMSWVRENTSQNAVFAHWWDYGYWVQSIGERASVLDGGNAILYWDHLLGRYVLTGNDEKKSLEFLYAHNTTHLLIDSTDIGKYAAFSSIGADENYDRYSWIQTFLNDEKQTIETQNETTYVYAGGSPVDEDIIWKENDKEIFLPRGRAVVGAIVLTRNIDKNFSQPRAIFVYNSQQYNIPLRFLYYGGVLKDFNSGLDSGIFLFPSVNAAGNNQIAINEVGALLYLSKRTVNSQLVRLYLFDQKSDYFKLAHTESNLLIENLKSQVPNIGEFIYYQGFQGPIKIWEINYPKDIKLNQEFLKTDYPNMELKIAKKGVY